ncbi:DoxX family protein [[Mycobacterium] wendilense]|uniref:DoxX family protein n=1 Tax=[Mycobacterium] wendilense TaxID=3064284 RepID=A0ABM9MIH7_9MYCO|nr:DoxX family protein [Mycolicibacterium sp. MU0050]CAJ1586009.1 DoxX family protein [Mycolicibacterium sp. MU0050]
MTSADCAVLLLRACIGLTMCAHGYAKLFRGGRIPGTARWFDSLGMRPGAVHAWLAAVCEVGSGLFLALGLLTPFAAAAFVSLMLVAARTVHRGDGFFVTANGWEYNLVLAVSAVSVAIAGAGRLSIDWLALGRDLWSGWSGLLISVGGGVTAAMVLLGVSFRPARAASTEQT